MSGHCVEVPSASRRAIRDLAKQVREMLAVTGPHFPIVECIEVYHRIDKDFVYDIREIEFMGDNHGLTYPDKKLMLIREDVYEGATRGVGRDRMTIGHELGHLLMHGNVGLARRVSAASIPAYRSSEWQANCFGGELLVSRAHIHVCTGPEDVAELFGVSLEAARVQWKVFKEGK